MSKCLLCGNELPKKHLLSCKNMPSGAQNIPTECELSQDRGIDLNLYQCVGCGLIQFNCEPVNYYRDVIRAGGYSTTMTNLRREQYKHFIDKYGLQGKKIIEIGAGQGEFLMPLTGFPVEVYGIEHKADLVEKARSNGLNVIEKFTESPETELFPGVKFDAFLSFNFLEHQPYPNDMLQCIYRNLNDEAYGLITVPSFEYIIENDSFYELLRDHIANYTEEALRFALEKNGFTVLEFRRINRDTHEAIVKKRPMVDVSGLKQNMDTLAKQMQDYVRVHKEQGHKVAIWGASHQGFTAAATTGVAEMISYIIDSAPFKQGKFAPASHLPIVPSTRFFEEPVDSILIIAPGYTDEIAATIRKMYGETVEIAVLRSAQIEILD